MMYTLFITLFLITWCKAEQAPNSPSMNVLNTDGGYHRQGNPSINSENESHLIPYTPDRIPMASEYQSDSDYSGKREIIPDADEPGQSGDEVFMDEQKRARPRYEFGIGRRSVEIPIYEDVFDELEKREGERFRAPKVYSFGIGKKSRYNFGIGKKSTDPYEFIRNLKRRYNFGIGKRSPRTYSFGLGK
ncbi:allatostatin A [Brevipalpus obovatus]|uniref:allatostatin A n=1 Tax=Brevipalpus obovatus TaxID=246614 RepID=UPI003D9ED1F2